jgi:protein-S-isoprenylcysteine O-methyltransferase Ste14
MTKNNANVKIIPPLVPLLAIIISWLLNDYLYNLPIPLETKVQFILVYFFMLSAITLFGFSLYFFIKFKQNPDPHTPTASLYTSGIFRISRNPIYLGFLFAQMVVALKYNNLYMIISIPLIVYFLTVLVIKPEEDYLEQQFGNQYLDYKKKVRRWI